MKAMGIPIKSTGELLAIREPAPWLGQHTDEVLKTIGYAEREIQALHAAGVLYDKYGETAPKSGGAEKIAAR
jgi:formyl-CoA transferase